MLSLETVVGNIFPNIWTFIMIAIVIAFFKSSWMKGKVGEAIVNTSNQLLLDKDLYTPVKNITLQLADGSTTQIDHILVSKYGIFVIETKNMKGWIFGGEHQKQWTQQIFKAKQKFQNPLHQNYRHLKALEEILELPASHFTSVIAFVGECAFKTPMPENVFCGLSYRSYIQSFRDERLNPLEIRQTLVRLQRKGLKRGVATEREHVDHLKRRFEKATAAANGPVCQRCGSPLVRRHNRKTGDAFYGCSDDPRCKYTERIS